MKSKTAAFLWNPSASAVEQQFRTYSNKPVISGDSLNVSTTYLESSVSLHPSQCETTLVLKYRRSFRVLLKPVQSKAMPSVKERKKSNERQQPYIWVEVCVTKKCIRSVRKSPLARKKWYLNREENWRQSIPSWNCKNNSFPNSQNNWANWTSQINLESWWLWRLKTKSRGSFRQVQSASRPLICSTRNKAK